MIWLFPWTGLALSARRLSFRPATRAGRGNLLMAASCSFTLLFFLASTTQEYYTLPSYAPAMLLLAGAAAASARQLTLACRIAATVYGLALAAALALLALAGPAPNAGDISDALASSPEAYTLSLGHFQDLTLEAFAFLRTPLCLAAAAFAIGTCGGWCLTGRRAAGAVLCAAGLLLHAAHQAMAVFEPHLSSRHLARAYLEAPPGILVLDHEYYAFSSLVFYANRPVLLLNGRRNAIEYGSYAPGAPDVFLDDQGLAKLWSGGEPAYLATYSADIPRIKELVGTRGVSLVARGGGKALLGVPQAAPSSARSPRPQASATVVGGLARNPAGPQDSARTSGTRP